MSKNMPSHRAKFSRHSFDVSAGYTSTLCPGAIVPQYFDILQPGDSVYYKTIAFSRLRDVVTAFLGEVDIHFDYFFVPLQMMYTPFGNVFFGVDESINDQLEAQTVSLNGKFPLLNINGSIHKYSNHDFPLTDNFECWGKSIMRLLNALDYNPYCVLDQIQADKESTLVDSSIAYSSNGGMASPFIFAAYQAIYQKYYRNDDIERLNVRSFNFDSQYSSSTFQREEMLYLRYCQRPFDYFTGIKVSPIASAVSGNGATQEVQADVTINMHGGNMVNNQYLARVNNWLGNDSNNNLPYSSTDEDASTMGSNSTAVYNSNDYDNITSNLRALFAVEKYLKIWGRADKTYDDQVLAHFGYKVPHDVKHQITHLKHNKMVIQSDPVFASGSEEYALGQVGGQASGSLTSDGDKFTAPVHGVFMCVAYAVTKPRYQDTCSKLHFIGDRLDLPIPEYDKLGMQPLFGFEFNPLFMTSAQDAQESGYTWNARAGWQYRYNQYKQKYNRISLAYGLFQGYYKIQQDVNAYRPWVLSRQPFTLQYDVDTVKSYEDYGLGFMSLYETPHALDTVMVQEYSGDWSTAYYNHPHMIFDTDPIILEYLCDCKKVSWMSETGEPEL